MSNIIPKLKSGLTLFCACVEYSNGKSLIAKTLYMEAPDLATARANFILKLPRGGRIIEVAPTVGFHVQDEHGEKLRA